MAQLIADRQDMDFALYEQFGIQSLFKFARYKDLNKKMVDMILTEARNLGIREILPTAAAGDKEGVVFDNGKVKVPESFHRARTLLAEGEWIALTEDPEIGGQGLPHVVASAAKEYLVGANFAFMAFATLGHGAGKMIELYGTDEQKRLYLGNLYSGKWGGTMLLTEPDAGSDVGALTTSARKNPDGTYQISGNKIFITNGEHDLTENIIHPVLARVEGAPEGSKGISLFLVPKILVNEKGELTEPNDVVCTGVEEKLGLHGSPTCSLALGQKSECKGYLLGQENKGLMIMFHMMNEARLGVGAQGFLNGSAAYLHALDYARSRIQGRALDAARDKSAPQIPIIGHPDVRRMLMWMKAHVDGMRSFIYYVSLCFDWARLSEKDEDKAKFKAFTDLLTPVVKAYCSDRGFDVCSMAIQVFGGYGYTCEYPVEQLFRDCRIASIYEGTNGIQAMDLLGRKLGMNKGRVFAAFLAEIQKTVDAARAIEAVSGLADPMARAMADLGDTAALLGKRASGKDFKSAFATASDFLNAMGDVITAWMLLWRAAAAAKGLAKSASGKKAAFYQGQIHTAGFFMDQVLPVTAGRLAAVRKGGQAAVDMPEDGFGGF